MGFDPQQVGRMTPWQFMACLDGYGRSNGWKATGDGSAAAALSNDQLRDMGIEGF